MRSISLQHEPTYHPCQLDNQTVNQLSRFVVEMRAEDISEVDVEAFRGLCYWPGIVDEMIEVAADNYAKGRVCWKMQIRKYYWPVVMLQWSMYNKGTSKGYLHRALSTLVADTPDYTCPVLRNIDTVDNWLAYVKVQIAREVAEDKELGLHVAG